MFNNGFTKKSVGTLTLGEKLKKLRSDRRISLNEVSRYTKIPLKYLTYLDEGVYEKLPADVYVKGFLKNYAEFLGVEEKNLIRLFDKEKEIKINLEKGKGKNSFVAEKKKPLDISSFVITPKLIVTALVLISIVGGFFYLYKEMGSFSGNPRLVILSPENNYSMESNSVTVEGVTDRDAKVFINDQPILVNDEGKFREDLTVQAGTNLINIKAVNRFDRESSKAITIQSNYQEKSTGENNNQDNPREISTQKGIEIEVKIDPGPVWLSIETDNNLVFSGTMLTGAIQTFKADNKITVNSGRGNATHLKFNGKDIGTLSNDTAAVRNVIFDNNTKY